MKHEIVAVKNVVRMMQAEKSLLHRGYGTPGMGILDGLPGLGKSLTATWSMVRNVGLYIRVLSVSTQASFLASICKELDILPMSTAAKMVDAIVARLAQEGRPLYIDEADKLMARKRLIEITRDLHDLSTVPVILIGEGTLRQQVNAIPRLAGRVLETVEFLPLDMEDAELMARRLCEVEVASDLVHAVNTAGKGSARLLVVALHKIERRAQAANKRKMSLDDWAKGDDFFLGDTGSRSRGR